jgi:hypothetical protein
VRIGGDMVISPHPLFLLNFRELRYGEVLRIFLPRTPVNRGRQEGRARSLKVTPIERPSFARLRLAGSPTLEHEVD